MTDLLTKALTRHRLISAPLFTAAVLSFSQYAIKARAENGAGTYHSSPFEIGAVEDRLIPADMNGDGLMDIVVGAKAKISVYLQRLPLEDGKATGFDFSSADAELELPGSATGWDIDYGQGRVGAGTGHFISTENSSTGQGRRLLALVDGRQVWSWSLSEQGFSEGQLLLDGVAGKGPPGFYPLQFVRDVNSDGWSDFLLPSTDGLLLYLRDSSGDYRQPLQLAVDFGQYSNLEVDYLGDRVGNTIVVRDLLLRDINGDHRDDILLQGDEGLDIFLAGENGAYSDQPSFSDDIGRELELEFKDFQENLDNLSRLSNRLEVSYTIDVDNDGVLDYILKEENKVSIFKGTASGFDLDKPKQILKSSGNLMFPLLYDEDGDELKDLVLVRIEDISVGDLLLKAVLSSSIDIESFIYRNEGDKFSTRPHRKVTTGIDLPALTKLPKVFSELEGGKVLRSTVAAVDADGVEDDLVVLRRETLVIFKNIQALRGNEVEVLTAEFLGVSGEGDRHSHELMELARLWQNIHSYWVKNQAPDLSLPIDAGDDKLNLDIADIKAVDLNGDQRDDFFVFTDRDESSVSGYLLLSR